MCEVIQSDAFLAYILRKKSRITVQQLKKIRDFIINEDPSLYIDISKPAIELIIYYYPKLFNWDGSEISFSDEAESYNDFINNTFINPFPESQIKSIDRSLATIG